VRQVQSPKATRFPGSNFTVGVETIDGPGRITYRSVGSLAEVNANRTIPSDGGWLAQHRLMLRNVI
jgi:hypothetical protein